LEQHDADLRRQAEGLEQQNADLQRHVEGLEQHNEHLQRRSEASRQQNEDLQRHSEGLKQHNDQLAGEIIRLNQEMIQERFVRTHSLRWLLGSLRAELLRRLRGRSAE
jgi:uncharacterized protein (DUF3084 family)